MRINIFSQETQDGLRRWAHDVHGDELIFDDNASSSEFWAWIWFQLREAVDRAVWFPKGKWATLQFLEQQLIEEVRLATFMRRLPTTPIERSP